MSADNYILIRKDEYGKYVVTNESASDEEPQPVRKTDVRFDTVDQAWQYAGGIYAEYGVEFGFPVEMSVKDTSMEATDSG